VSSEAARGEIESSLPFIIQKPPNFPTQCFCSLPVIVFQTRVQLISWRQNTLSLTRVMTLRSHHSNINYFYIPFQSQESVQSVHSAFTVGNISVLTLTRIILRRMHLNEQLTL